MSVSTAGLSSVLYSSSASGSKGGDIYYLSVCNNNLLTRIVVADVVGHGEEVSRMSQFIYDALVANMNKTDNSLLMAELNQIAIQKGISAMTTAAVASYYKTNGQFSFSYAGHHPILVNKFGRPSWEELKISGSAGKGEIINTPFGTVCTG